MRIYEGSYERRSRPEVADYAGGDKLVRPVHLRRVPIQEGKALHFTYAKSKLREAAFFPPDARLRRNALTTDALHVIEGAP